MHRFGLRDVERHASGQGIEGEAVVDKREVN